MTIWIGIIITVIMWLIELIFFSDDEDEESQASESGVTAQEDFDPSVEVLSEMPSAYMVDPAISGEMGVKVEDSTALLDDDLADGNSGDGSSSSSFWSTIGKILIWTPLALALFWALGSDDEDEKLAVVPDDQNPDLIEEID